MLQFNVLLASGSETLNLTCKFSVVRLSCKFKVELIIKDETLFLNAAICNDDYDPIRMPHIIEIDTETKTII